MDLSALVQRYGSVPEHLQKEADEIWSHLQKQSEHVISAKVTSNFGVDIENTAVRPEKVHWRDRDAQTRLRDFGEGFVGASESEPVRALSRG